MSVRRRNDGRIESYEFRLAVVNALRDLSAGAQGGAQAKDVINRVKNTLPLTDADYEPYGSNPYFQHMCHKARRELVDDGVLLPEEDSGTGWWQFADE